MQRTADVARDARSRRPDGDLTEVKGMFHDREDVENAVYRLGQESVPSDTISVWVEDKNGDKIRELDVENEAGTLRGAFWGAAGGALIGVVIALLVPTGVFGPAPVELYDASTLAFAVGVVAILAVAGLPLGAFFALGHWRVGTRIPEREMRQGSLWVSVRSDEMADVARRVMRECGAERLAD
ncbi:MAG: hypothetical protein PVJ80_18020 [Gemmatimonadota bacterium]|jgi:hypothetical protein